MRRELKRWGYTDPTKILRIVDDDGKVLSWALLTPPKRHRPNTPATRGFQVYTRASERRKGHAKALYRRAVQIAHGKASVYVEPHDKRSEDFFTSVINGKKKA